MDKETLSNYGWIVICTLVLAVMLAFASPFGNFVAGAVQVTTQGLFDTNQSALDSANIEIMQQEFEQMLNANESLLHYGEPYSCADTDLGCIFVYIFNQDGSIDMKLVSEGEVLYEETAPANSFEVEEQNIIDTASGDVVGIISSNGQSIDMDGMIFVLGEGCFHTNTEVRNATNNYTAI